MAGKAGQPGVEPELEVEAELAREGELEMEAEVAAEAEPGTEAGAGNGEREAMAGDPRDGADPGRNRAGGGVRRGHDLALPVP